MSWSFVLISAFLFVVFIVSDVEFRLYDLDWDGKKTSHRLLFYGVVAICLFMAAAVFADIHRPSLAYPFSDELSRLNAYEQQFDAFQKGQLHIDVPVSKELLSLPNPFDWEQRSEACVFYLWDRALYGGRFYSYFGPAPILTVYYPFYWLTGRVPSASQVCFILAAVCVVAVALLVLRAATGFCGRVDLSLLLFFMTAAEFGSLLYMLEACADMYYIAALSAVCNLALFFLFTLTAFFAQKTGKSCACHVLAGVFFVLTVMSRPGAALLGLIAAPLFLHVMFSKKYGRGGRAARLLCFAVPTALGAAVQMVYNAARFGSPFDFGAAYQLTVYDVSRYALTPALFSPALYHYFLQAPGLDPRFPYVRLLFSDFKGSFPSYVYLTRTLGALCFPSVPCGFLAPLVRLKKELPWKRWFYALGVLAPVALAFLNTCLGGVNIRYLADLMLTCVLVSGLLLMDFYADLSGRKRAARLTAHIFISAAFCLTTALGFLLIFENERRSLFG